MNNIKILLLIVITLGCIQPMLSSNVNYVMLSIIPNDMYWNVQLILLDTQNEPAAADGEVYLRVFTDNRTLYQEKFNIYKENFTIEKPYYSWKIKVSDIKKVYPSEAIGKAEVIFKTDNRTINNVIEVPLVVYTKEEMERLFIDNSKKYSKSKEISGLKVTLVRGGYFNYDIDTDMEFRINYEIKNLKSETKNYNPFDSFVIIDSVQYSSMYNSITSTTIYPNSSLEGYIIFDDISQNLTNKTMKVILGSTIYNGIKNFEFEIKI